MTDVFYPVDGPSSRRRMRRLFWRIVHDVLLTLGVIGALALGLAGQ